MLEHPDTAALDEISLPADTEFQGDSSDELRARVKGELDPGERLLWAARSHGVSAQFGAGFYGLCGLAVLVFGVGLSILAYEAGARPSNADRAFAGVMGLGAGLFLLALLALTWNNRCAEAARAGKFCYAITDRRAIIWAPDKGDATRVYAIPRGQVRGIVRVERPDGTGDLELTVGDGIHYHYPFHPLGFRRVAEVRRVEQIVRNYLLMRETGGA